MSTASRWWVGVAFVALLAVSGAFFFKYQQSNTALADLRAEDEATRERYGEALSSIAAIQDSLDAIVLGDEAVRLSSRSFDEEAALNTSEGDVVLGKIGLLRAGIERSKARIQELDDHLRKNGMQIEGLEKMVASLRRSVSDKEARIAILVERVQSLTTEVHGLTASVEEKRQELGTVYVVMGDRRELTQSGVVVATGGVLGLGKSLKPSGYMNEAVATPVDTDLETVVEIPAPGAQVLTPQPSSSYTLETNGEVTLLRILDPREFRKIRHVVILTRNTA